MIDIKDQEKKLLAQLKELEEELNSLGRQHTENGDWVAMPEQEGERRPDPVDDADRTEAFEGRLAIMNVLEKKYAQVKKALDRIEDGTYGFSEIDGAPIPEERLKAEPSATTNINDK